MPDESYRCVGGDCDGQRVRYGGSEVTISVPTFNPIEEVLNEGTTPPSVHSYRYTLREIACKPRGCTVHFYAPWYMTDYEVLRHAFG